MSLPNAVPGIFASTAKVVSVALATRRDLGPLTQQNSIYPADGKSSSWCL